jgi:hypothetical protein
MCLLLLLLGLLRRQLPLQQLLLCVLQVGVVALELLLHRCSGQGLECFQCLWG